MAVSTALDAVRLGSSEVAALYLGSDSVWTANAPGMVLVSPTSITHSGTSATLGANGQVTFTAVTSLSLNGVFSADFDNYALTISAIATAPMDFTLRLRNAGSDSTGSDYTYQYLLANGSGVSGARTTNATSGIFANADNTQSSGYQLAIYGPYLAQPTAYRCVDAYGREGARMYNFAGTHSLSTAYDGITFAGGTITGALQVYGVRS